MKKYTSVLIPEEAGNTRIKLQIIRGDLRARGQGSGVGNMTVVRSDRNITG